MMMRRKRHHHAEEHDNHERWLISFADYMTLLFALFVVLYALASTEKGQSDKVIQGIVQSLQQQGLISSHNNSPIFDGGVGITGSNSTIDLVLAEKLDNETFNTSSNIGSSIIQLSRTPTPTKSSADVYQYISEALRKELDSGEIEIEQLGQQLNIKIKSSIAFAQNSHFLQPKFSPLVKNIAKAIEDLPGMIMVTGYSDNSIPDPQLYRNNIELSALRAVSIASTLMQNPRIEPNRIKASGAGQLKVLDHSNAGNQRVAEISILQGSALNVTHSL
ncbi:flagellar motor protein MotB [Vibrio alfacsensis]|uniref:flagellar motor protein MotB n=1 Tax=Vibrio alfacsensis TaxID=1074311 RepID=UPI001C7F46E5|nr:flagellar motor protein MotB [Vibrio alfacsensis]